MTKETYLVKSTGELVILYSIVRNGPLYLWREVVLEKEVIFHPKVWIWERLQAWSSFRLSESTQFDATMLSFLSLCSCNCSYHRYDTNLLAATLIGVKLLSWNHTLGWKRFKLCLLSFVEFLKTALALWMNHHTLPTVTHFQPHSTNVFRMTYSL